jgi:putative transposase-like DNA-binding protein
MTTLVYRYGVPAPHENADLVHEQMRLGHLYHVTLAHIERGRRWAERRARSAASAELAAAESELVGIEGAIDWLASEIRQTRKKDRARTETAPARERLTAARALAKEARARLYAIRNRYASQCKECRKQKSEENPCPHATVEARVLRAQLDAIDEQANVLYKNARDHSGLFWGSYQIVERAHRASCAAPLYDKDGITPHDPEVPRRWDGSGAVGIQIQSTNPLTVEGALAGEDSRLRVRASPWPEEWLAGATLAARPPRRTDSVVGAGARGRRPPGTLPGFTRCRACKELDRQRPCPHAATLHTPGVTRCRDCDRQPCPHAVPDVPAPATRPDGTPAGWVRARAARHGEVRLRVDSDAAREPVWAAWRLDYHRPLPPRARVTWVAVHRRVRGPHAEWSLCLTVDLAASTDGPETTTDRPSVAIDVGWRLMGDGSIRVAAWHDSLGRSGELRLTADDVRALRAHEVVRSERDRAFDLCKLQLKRWADTYMYTPDWLREEVRTIHSWRNPGRLVSLLNRWENPKRDGIPTPRDAAEDAALQAVRAWAMGDRARWAAEEARRVWGLRRRRSKYREFVAQMTETYGVVVLEQFDLRKIAERKPTGADSAENEVARSNRQLASVSDLRDCLVSAAPRRGCTVAAVDAARTTSTCPACGLVADRDAAARVRLTCECGHEWDQDRDGAAPMLLGRWVEHPGDAKIVAAARDDGKDAEDKAKKSERWARARRMGTAKKARVASARK